MMTITYTVGNGLYVNITNRCPNNCTFCIRNNGEGAYGSDSLWLDREPTEDEIFESIVSSDPTKYSELVFCGYGEPTERLDTLIAVAKRVKAKYPELSIRVNTNGLSDLINGRDTSADFEGAVDVLSVSMNAATPEKYQEVCLSKFGLEAYGAMLEFCKNAKHHVKKVLLTVVEGTISNEEIEICRKNANAAGVELRV
ncbi:MAG: TatD family nuclease-associated radical SAM protein, partial [Clostridia bacterium]|nr:TatD family nuclease-associated radical SAM protein [Clostridia bacterium]